MASNEGKTPEIFKIKGYKYRAKMLAAGAVIIIILIVIIVSIVHGISSAIHKNTASVSSDTDIDTDNVVSSSSSVSSSLTSSFDSSALSYKEEKLDADGKVIIDTDTLDGKKAVAITFDDGPSEYTSGLIDELNARNVHATFFMVGSCVERYPEAVVKMRDSGHQLGNHSYDHSDLSKLSTAAALNQISQTDEAVMNACGQRTTAFRPPYGSYTDDLLRNVDKTVTLWSLDSLDWKSKDMGKVKNTIVSQCHDGSIILLHDLYKSSVDGALAAIDELKGEGYEFVTVNELMTRYGYGISTGAHFSQYAVYETNSPHADEYKDDMERDKQKLYGDTDTSASVGTSSAFYYERQSDRDPDDNSSNTVNSANTGNSDNSVSSEYNVNPYYKREESSDTASRLVY